MPDVSSDSSQALTETPQNTSEPDTSESADRSLPIESPRQAESDFSKKSSLQPTQPSDSYRAAHGPSEACIEKEAAEMAASTEYQPESQPEKKKGIEKAKDIAKYGVRERHENEDVHSRTMSPAEGSESHCTLSEDNTDHIINTPDAATSLKSSAEPAVHVSSLTADSVSLDDGFSVQGDSEAGPPVEERRVTPDSVSHNGTDGKFSIFSQC